MMKLTQRNFFSGVFLLIAVLIILPFTRKNFIEGISAFKNPVRIFASEPFEILPYGAPRNRYANLPSGLSYFLGRLYFKSDRETKISDVAKLAVTYTRYYSYQQLAGDIKTVNALTSEVLPQSVALIIPNPLSERLAPAINSRRVKIPFVKGIYLTALSAGSNSLIQSLDEYTSRGINSVVFDIKDVGGNLSYKSNVRLARELDLCKGYTIDDLDKLVSGMKRKHIYTIARIACFRDHMLAKLRPDMAIRSKSGGLWNANSGEIWLDPTNKKTQEYIINLAIEVAESGVDEIQFDYIRFPTSSGLSDAIYAWDFGRMKRDDAIPLFLKRVRGELLKRNVNLSIDIFGVVAWGDQKDIDSTGQCIAKLAPYADAISPMLYPSHFSDNFDGFARPGDNPYYFISKGVDLVKKQAPGAVIRPWLQAFAWRISAYNEKYIIDQVKGSDASGGYGYLFWNASSNYDKVLGAFAPGSPKESRTPKQAKNSKSKKPGGNI